MFNVQTPNLTDFFRFILIFIWLVTNIRELSKGRAQLTLADGRLSGTCLISTPWVPVKCMPRGSNGLGGQLRLQSPQAVLRAAPRESAFLSFGPEIQYFLLVGQCFSVDTQSWYIHKWAWLCANKTYFYEHWNLIFTECSCIMKYCSFDFFGQPFINVKTMFSCWGHISWFPLYETSRTGKPTETESRSVGAMDLGRRGDS